MKEGSQVVCVDDSWPQGIEKYYTDLPVKNRIYTVRTIEVGVGWDGMAGEIAVTLKEIVNPVSKTPPHRERGFRQERFREVEPPQADQKEKLEELEQVA